MLKYIHGSEDSTDVDVMYIFDEIPTKADASRFCSDNTVENKNIAVVRDGVVVWVYKGTVDEVNNALYMTIPLHDNPPSIITRMVERDILAKTIRVMRGSLTHASRTIWRERIKEATRSYSWTRRCAVFSEIDYSAIQDYGKGKSLIEQWKFFAFQWGQLCGLLEGKELYTKSAMAEYYPTLRPYLYRQETSFESLRVFMELVGRHFYMLETIEQDGKVVFANYHGVSTAVLPDVRVYDLAQEVELDNF